jgi:negative regulator of sigma F NrsF-like protein
MSLSPDLKQRVFASLADVPSPTRAEVRRARVWLFGCGIVGAFVIFFLEGGVRVMSRPPSLVALSSLGTAAIVGTGMWMLLTRGRSALGRPVSWLLASALLASVLFVAWRYGVSALYGDAQIARWPARPGFRCLALSVITGALPLLGALLSWRRTIPVSPVATGAAFGAGAGLGSALLVDLWCPVSYLPHLFLGHLLPIGVLALLGGVLGSRLLRLAWR